MILILILLSLSVSDLLFTIIAIESGLATEGNPVVQWYIRHTGYLGVAAFKLSGISILTIIYMVAQDKTPIYKGIKICIIAYSVTLVYHIAMLLRSLVI